MTGQPWTDSYTVVLATRPESDVWVTVDPAATPTSSGSGGCWTTG